jgi:Fic family protein
MIFQTPELEPTEDAVLARIDHLRARVRAYVRDPARWTGLLRRNIFAKAIQGSNTIEGYNISVDDAIAAVEGEEPLQADQATWAEIVGYRQAMTYVIQLARDPLFRLSVDQIKGLHYMLLSHDLTKSPGHWRPGYVAVRDGSTGAIVYEAPDAALVPQLMAELVESLNVDEQSHAIVRGAMAHLNLTMIHPFRDGNGRMARALQTLILGRGGPLAPELSSIEEYLGRNTDDYYAVLARVARGSWHPEEDSRPWIRFCLTAHFRQAQTVLYRIERIERLWAALEELIVSRGLPERTLLALADAAMGYRVRNPIYRKAAEVSANVASRDLGWLVREGLLEPTGEKKHRYYLASDVIAEVSKRVETPNKFIEDPFGATP